MLLLSHDAAQEAAVLPPPHAGVGGDEVTGRSGGGTCPTTDVCDWPIGRLSALDINKVVSIHSLMN